MKSISDNSLGGSDTSSNSRVPNISDREKLSQRLMNISLTALGRRRLTEFQLREYLHKKIFGKGNGNGNGNKNFSSKNSLKKYSSEDVEEVMKNIMDRLKKAGYLNDTEYAELFIRDVMQYRPHGSMWITMQLTKKGVDRNLIASVFEKIREEASTDTEHEAARAAAEKKLKTLERFDPKKRYEKIFRFLCGRGFSASMVFRVLDEMGMLRTSGSRSE